MEGDVMSDPHMIFVPLDATEEDMDGIVPPEPFTPTLKEAHDERLAVCKACDRYIKATSTCRECGCFMAVKTWIPAAHCPLPDPKWGAVNG